MANKRGTLARHSSVVPHEHALATLRNATGAVAFWYGSYGVTMDSSSRVSSWASRVGSYTVAQATDGNKPVVSAASPSGKLGLTFTAASQQRLVAPDGVLAGILDGSQAYSALLVAKWASTGNTQAIWSVGGSGAEFFFEGCINTGSNPDRIQRSDSGGGTSANGNEHGTSAFCKTTVYTGSAYSTWINGVASLVASANTRAPVCDGFSIGSRFVSGAHSNHFGGVVYALLISTSQWASGERTALENAAKIYWGTP